MRFRGAGAGLKPFYGIIDIAKIHKRHLYYMVYYKYINVCLSNISYYSTLPYINDIHFINSILNDKSFSLSTYHNPFVLMCLEFKLWIRKKAAARKNERILSIVMNIFSGEEENWGLIQKTLKLVSYLYFLSFYFCSRVAQGRWTIFPVCSSTETSTHQRISGKKDGIAN